MLHATCSKSPAAHKHGYCPSEGKQNVASAVSSGKREDCNVVSASCRTPLVVLSSTPCGGFFLWMPGQELMTEVEVQKWKMNLFLF